MDFEEMEQQISDYAKAHQVVLDYTAQSIEVLDEIMETFYEKVNQCSEEEGDEILAEWAVCYTMDNEHSKIVKTMRNAIKNGNLDVVKKLLGSNGGLLTVPKYSIWFMAAYCCLIWKDRYCELPY